MSYRIASRYKLARTGLSDVSHSREAIFPIQPQVAFLAGNESQAE